MRHTAGITTIAALFVAVQLLGGCQRRSAEGESSDAPTAATRDAAAVETATGSSDVVPAQVLHWDCDGGLTLTTKYLAQDNAISLGLHEGERKLPHVIAASGEKYQDGPISFWAKGGTAIYERMPAPPVNCRLQPG